MSQLLETERLIAQARAHISAGRKCIELKQPFDLRGLETLIAGITANLSDMPHEQALSQRNTLLVLFDELGQLDEAITKLHRETGEQLRQMSTQRQANSAYSNPSKG